ncbi:hypothetical protein [Nocardiopsis xinjiangensis]|uniref:hypothetical protein n=1 Tax=Nocardiopsis xinjiangensis TaxID=124285 RepID=UPI000345BC67|nr:hypothetical protein [Nocardiopsis xinjiangensis]
MSPVPALVCALLLCGAPPHATGLTGARTAPDPGASVLASGAAGPSAVPAPVSDEAEPGLDRPVPTPTPTPRPALPPEADAASTAQADPGPTRAPFSEPPRENTPVVRYTAASPEPTTAASGVLGHVSTGLLAVLAVLVLGLRLSVGWPRFPVPYLGRRRRPSARRCG